MEDHAPALQEWMVAARLANADLLAPPLLRYEIGHFLSRRADLAPEQRERALREMLLGFRFTDGLDAFRFAPPLTYYDAAYLAAAVSLKAVLVSYDQVLLDAARQAGLRTSSPGLDA